MPPSKPTVAPRILVVEDEAIIALDLKRRLERLGCEVVGVADNGADALALAAKERPTLVFMDIVIQGHMDGIETASALARKMDVPIVFLTAHADEATIQRAKTVGPYGYVVKPFEDRELHTTIEMALYRHRSEANARFSQQALSTASIGIMIADATNVDSQVIQCNAALLEMTGYTEEELLGQRTAFLLGESTDPAEATTFLTALTNKQECQLTLQLHGKAGKKFWCDLSLSVVRDLLGEVSHFLCFYSDVTKRRQSEEALLQATKMEAIGQITAGVAHDFNNSLMVIQAFAGFVRDALPEVDARRDDINELLHAADTAAGLTRQLLTFSRQQPTQKHPIDINQSLAASLGMLRRSAGKRVEVRATLSSQPAVVRMDAVQIDQILLNMSLNARDAMPEGGLLEFVLSCPPPEAAGVALVRLAISDSGIGMDDKTAARVFEPFFTTKSASEGTGLGLASCFAIVKDARGTISIETSLGKGATFIIEIPMCNQPVEQRAQPAKLERALGEHILVVEDQRGLRRATARMLQSAGYRVSQAVNGNEAIQLLKEQGKQVDLILTDIVMPGKGGFAVAQRAKSLAPNAKVMFTSGYLEGDAACEPLLSQILWKPYTKASLLAAAHGALSLVRASELSSEEPRSKGPEQRTGGRVLVVEDDKPIRVALERILSRAGYKVASVTSIAAARELLGADTDYSAILCDLSLDDGSGADLVEWIRGADPALAARTMVLTGGIVDDAGRKLETEGLTEILRKPIDPATLLKSVAAAALRLS